VAARRDLFWGMSVYFIVGIV